MRKTIRNPAAAVLCALPSGGLAQRTAQSPAGTRLFASAPDGRGTGREEEWCDGRNYKPGLIFETRADQGRLLVCAMDSDNDAANRPEVRQPKTRLPGYAAGNGSIRSRDFRKTRPNRYRFRK